MRDVRYTENETQLAVTVDTAYGWPPLGAAVMFVTYPSGRRYALQQEVFEKHFTVVSPQTIQASGGNVFEQRPTERQRELQEHMK